MHTLTLENLRGAMDAAGLTASQREAVEAAHTTYASSERARALLDAEVENLAAPDGVGRMLAQADVLQSIYGDAQHMHAVLALLARYGWLAGQYAAHGIPDQVLRDTLSDLRIWMDTCQRETGHCGLLEYNWLLQHFRFRVFRLGRVQFMPGRFPEIGQVYRSAWGEVCVLTPEGFAVDKEGHVRQERPILPVDVWQCVVAPGDPVLDIHIPEGEPLSPDKVLASLRAAPAFFKHALGMADIAAFYCHSWLLDPALKDILPGSNTAWFAQLFTCLPHDGNDWQMCERVFASLPYAQWAAIENPSGLQRAIRRFYDGGGRCHNTKGFILPSDIG